MYQKRLKGYAELGYQTLSEDMESSPGLIYSGQSYGETFGKDILTAGRELVISAPILAQSRIRAVLGQLPSGIKLKVITRDVESYSLEQQAGILGAIKLLEDAGASVVALPKLTQRYAVIDSAIVWYGDINFLSAVKAEDTAIRLESPELAGGLLDLETGAE
jgi:hypothetical protein